MSSNTNRSTVDINALYDPSAPSTTFVLVDPFSFRAVVQRLTGTTAPSLNSARTLICEGVAPRWQTFKLHERRHNPMIKKLEVQLGTSGVQSLSPPSEAAGSVRKRGFTPAASSPVSTLDLFQSPMTPPPAAEEDEQKAIAEKGFYLSPPGGAGPELLRLFPLSSPTDRSSSSSSSSCSCY